MTIISDMKKAWSKCLFFTGIMIQEIHKFDPGIPLMSPKRMLIPDLQGCQVFKRQKTIQDPHGKLYCPREEEKVSVQVIIFTFSQEIRSLPAESGAPKLNHLRPSVWEIQGQCGRIQGNSEW